MKEFIYQRFYGKPLNEVALIMIAFLYIWIVVYGEIFHKCKLKKLWYVINVLMLIADLAIIVVVTLFSRSGNSTLILTPFQSFKAAKIQPEIYRSMMMNIILFFPLGLAIPYILSDNYNYKVIVTIVFAMLCSAGVEFLQYYFRLGQAETDDVICNTLGAAIGTLGYLTRKHYDKHNNILEGLFLEEAKNEREKC